jgi:hypothetical protein
MSLGPRRLNRATLGRQLLLAREPLDAAFADRAVVKATLMRITLHAVHAQDYPAFHNAMVPSLRASRLHDRRCAPPRAPGRVIPPDYRRLVTRNNGDVLPTLLVDGYVAGVWRPADEGIQATAFHQLPDETWTGLAAEAAALTAFLADRDPTVYRRYTHWWAKLPSAEVRLLPG